MLPYGTGFCCYAFIYVSVRSFFSFLFLILSGSTISMCPSLMCLLNRASIEGANSSKILCLVFVYVHFVSYEFVSGPIL